MKTIEKAKQVIRIEAEAIAALENRIDDNFKKAVNLMYKCRGRIIVSGVGKSGVIGRKIAGTLNSTGTPAIFLHPSEGVHGDMGVVCKGDAVICISKSGNTEELYHLLPLFKRLGTPIIAMTGKQKSLLAQRSDVVLDISVEEEACPFDLAPTASTTAMLVMGDALAVALLDKKGFSRDDFALLHPGGIIGKKLMMMIKDVMYTDDAIPLVREDAQFKDVIVEMNAKRFGATCIVDKDNYLAGLITDGDLKRILEQTEDIFSVKISDVMSKNPITIQPDKLAVEALRIMEDYNILQIIVVNGEKSPIGMIHLHDLLEAGL